MGCSMRDDLPALNLRVTLSASERRRVVDIAVRTNSMKRNEMVLNL